MRFGVRSHTHRRVKRHWGRITQVLLALSVGGRGTPTLRTRQASVLAVCFGRGSLNPSPTARQSRWYSTRPRCSHLYAVQLLEPLQYDLRVCVHTTRARGADTQLVWSAHGD
jgi:hypothetical protein